MHDLAVSMIEGVLNLSFCILNLHKMECWFTKNIPTLFGCPRRNIIYSSLTLLSFDFFHGSTFSASVSYIIPFH